MTYRNLETDADLDLSAADRIEEYLLQSYEMRRRPTAAARVLALVCDLWRRGLPFPQREAVARQAGCSVFGVDAILSNYLARGEITLETKLVPGNVKQRDSVIRQKFYIPSDELLMAAGAGKQARRRVA